MDDRAQLEAESLAQLPQVGEAAGTQRAVRVPRSPQEGVDQGLPVLDDQIPCKREQNCGSWQCQMVQCLDRKEMQEPHPALELAPSTAQSSASPLAPRAAALHCTERVDATSRAMLLPSRIVLRTCCRQTPNGDLLCCWGLTDHCLGLLRASQTPSVCC